MAEKIKAWEIDCETLCSQQTGKMMAWHSAGDFLVIYYFTNLLFY